MKIEHIIDDIKEDILALTIALEEKLRQLQPGVQFLISTPGLEEMSTIKSIAIELQGATESYYFSVLVHTHNGCRVFEQAALVFSNGIPQPFTGRHPVQISFVNGLREVIKKKKCRSKAPKRAAALFNNLQQYANTG